MLGHLVFVDDFADANSDRVFVSELSSVDQSANPQQFSMDALQRFLTRLLSIADLEDKIARLRTAANSGCLSGCPITLTGDVNVSGAITSADIIYMVGFVFKGGAGPLPCDAAGDVNCSGAVTSADIIYMVGFVFKGGPDPCDGCTSGLVSEC